MVSEWTGWDHDLLLLESSWIFCDSIVDNMPLSICIISISLLYLAGSLFKYAVIHFPTFRILNHWALMKFPRHLSKLVQRPMDAGIWNVLNTKSQNCTSKWQGFKKNALTASWINQPKLNCSFNLSLEIFFLEVRDSLRERGWEVSIFTSCHLWKQSVLHIYSCVLYITQNYTF